MLIREPLRLFVLLLVVYARLMYLRGAEAPDIYNDVSRYTPRRFYGELVGTTAELTFNLPVNSAVMIKERSIQE